MANVTVHLRTGLVILSQQCLGQCCSGALLLPPPPIPHSDISLFVEIPGSGAPVQLHRPAHHPFATLDTLLSTRLELMPMPL